MNNAPDRYLGKAFRIVPIELQSEIEVLALLFCLHPTLECKGRQVNNRSVLLSTQIKKAYNILVDIKTLNERAVSFQLMGEKPNLKTGVLSTYLNLIQRMQFYHAKNYFSVTSISDDNDNCRSNSISDYDTCRSNNISDDNDTCRSNSISDDNDTCRSNSISDDNDTCRSNSISDDNDTCRSNSISDDNDM